MNVSCDSSAPETSAAGESPGKTSLRVLLVEDSQDDALLIANALWKGGFEPHWRRVDNADAMLNALTQERWEIILADHKLPSFSAMQAFSIYRESGLDFPFIIVSGKIGEEAAVAAMKAGVHDYVDKGRLARLAPAVRRALAEAQIRRDKGRMESQLQDAYEVLRQQRDALALQVHLINLSHDAFITTTPDGSITGWNAGATEMYGWAESEALGKPNRFIVPLASIPTPDIHLGLHRDGRWDGELVHIRRDGKTLVADSRQVLLRDVNGQPAATLEVNRDITQRKLAEEELKRALNEKVALLREVHHRVRNNLQVICSLLSLQARSVDTQETVAALQTSERRVMSMSMIHKQLYDQDNFSSLDFAEYCRDLVAKLFVLDSPHESITYRVEALPTTLTIEQAVPCGLILNELVTNALKHAYPAGNGEIFIRMTSDAETVSLTISDQGIGLPEGFNWQTAHSLGMTLLQILTIQLDGHLEMAPPPGASFTLRFKKLP